MPTGILFMLQKEGGIGMIAADGAEGQVFIHHGDLPPGVFDTLAQGDRVEFDTVQDSKGVRAKNVRKIVVPGEEIKVTETDQVPGAGGRFRIEIKKAKAPKAKARRKKKGSR